MYIYIYAIRTYVCASSAKPEVDGNLADHKLVASTSHWAEESSPQI